jgi:isoleucyl-tRNA synthetase
VRWLPEWGYDRIVAMVRERDDWCISRSAPLGPSIPVFYCSNVKSQSATHETIEIVAELFAKNGSNICLKGSFRESSGGITCPHCGGSISSRKQTRMTDWFDSGSTHIASLEKTTLPTGLPLWSWKAPINTGAVSVVPV